jgi:glucokinase
MSGSLALLADIGGTNARFALADTALAAPLLGHSVRSFEVAGFASLAAAARHYLELVAVGRDSELGGSAIGNGVFALAGRIDGDEARITNHPWIISRQATQAELGLPRLSFVNDFAAQAMAIRLLEPEHLATIGSLPWRAAPGASRTYAVLGPGTGLGVGALLVRDGRAFALETEGGHVSFAAGNDEETQLLGRLTERFGRVSNERLVSGGGLVNIHWALTEMAGEPVRELQPQDVTAGAAAGDPRCRHAVEIFCAVFGAISGDLALTLGAWDGVFLTGGLVPKLLPELQASAFRRRFEDKGRFSAAMTRVPTVAVLHPQAGLLGAAAFAREDALSPEREVAGR